MTGSDARDPYAGPFDALPWPTRLTARVVTPGPSPRVNGYDVEGDLAQNGYRFTDLVLLSLSGELPGEPQSKAFDVALTFLAPIAVHDAPTHAATLARICGGKPSAIVSTAAIGLGELARFTLEENAPLIAWLDAGASSAPPTNALARDDADRASTARLRTALHDTALDLPALAHDLSRVPALLVVLHACGLRRTEHLEVAMTVARLATTAAEGLSAKVAGFKEYPLDLPPFRYVEGP
jgi:hypothetical protein